MRIVWGREEGLVSEFDAIYALPPFLEICGDWFTQNRIEKWDKSCIKNCMCKLALKLKDAIDLVKSLSYFSFPPPLSPSPSRYFDFDSLSNMNQSQLGLKENVAFKDLV